MFDVYTIGYFYFISPNDRYNIVSSALKLGKDFWEPFIDVGQNLFLLSGIFFTYEMQMTMYILFDNTFGEIT